MLQISLLLILDIFLDIVITVMFHGRILIIHPKDTFNDSYIVKMSTTNSIMALKHSNLLIIKLRKMNKDTIKGSLIEDIPQEHVTSSLMFKCMLISRSHINGKGIPLEVFMQLLIL